MCSPTVLAFVERAILVDDVASKRVLEVGSQNFNGSVRSAIEALGPAEYIGVDIEAGPGVDEVVDACKLVQHFGPESFDLVLAIEMVEHVKDWRTVFSNLKLVCRSGGLIVVTTRSPGFGYHGYPHDYWRYEPNDMALIFADCAIQRMERDFLGLPGVFVSARPTSRVTVDLTPIALWSICTHDRRCDLTRTEIHRGRILAASADIWMRMKRSTPDCIRLPIRRRFPSRSWEAYRRALEEEATHPKPKDVN